jgi:hypothetical protein
VTHHGVRYEWRKQGFALEQRPHVEPTRGGAVEDVEERPITTGKGSIPVNERHRDPDAAARRLDCPANPAVSRSAVHQRDNSVPLPDRIGGSLRVQDA